MNLQDGNLGLVYKFHWDQNQLTEAAFNCDSNGKIREVNIRSDTSSVPPYAAATLAMQILGNIILSDDKEMTPEKRQQMQQLIDNSDAKGLLELWLSLST